MAVCSRQWSTATLEEGLLRTQHMEPSEMVAASGAAGPSNDADEKQMKAMHTLSEFLA